VEKPVQTLIKKSRIAGFKQARSTILLIIILIFILSEKDALPQTQVYPVSVTTQLAPPYSVNLADYAAPGCEQLKVIIVQRDLTQPPYMLYLKMEIELNGRVIVRSAPQYAPAFTIDPGIPTVISGSDLLPYFDPQNMIFSGFSGEKFLRTRLFPEGAYNITFTAYDWTRRDVALSRGGSMFCYLAKTDPPMLNLPSNNAFVSFASPQYLNFHWLSGNSTSPNSFNSTRYRFELFEMRLSGVTPSEVVQATLPVFTRETEGTSLVYSISEPVLEKGMRYVWRVRAYDILGRDFIRNNGYSEVYSFVYGDESQKTEPTVQTSIENFTATAVSPRKASLAWESAFSYDRYKIFYRKKGSENKWYESETSQKNIEIKGLSPGQIYECRVQGKRGIMWGSLSEIDTVLMPLLNIAECGSAQQPFALGSAEPVPELMRLQEFDAGGFNVTIIEVYPGSSPGLYSGKGFVQVPLFGHKKIRCEFTDVLINTDYQLAGGSVNLLCDKSQGGDNAIWNIDEIFEGGGEAGKIVDGTEAVDIVIPDVVISAPGSIILDTAGREILIVTETSDTVHIDVTSQLQDKSGSITMKDEEGNLYTVETNTGKTTSIGKAAPGGIKDQPATFSNEISGKKGTVVFESVSDVTRFAFDVKNKDYAMANIFNESYRAMEMDDGTVYNVPFKLIPVGESDQVLARVNIKSTTIKKDSLKFISSAGTVYKPQPTGKKDEYLLTLPSGKENDGLEIFATCNDSKGKTYVLGKLIVMSYPVITPKLVLVPVNGNGRDISAESVKQELDQVYSKVAVEWQVSIDENFEYQAGDLDITGSGLFSQYTDGMKMLNDEFVRQKGDSFDESAIYLFLLGESSDKTATGDMPRSRQFGYVFTETAEKGGDEALYRTIAHEIAHGAFNLKHTFDEQYRIPKGSTANLMDYTAGTSLVMHQWAAIQDPGLVIGMFEKDEDAASIFSGRLILLDEKHTLLLNHVYDNNKASSLKYLEKIEKSRQENSSEKSLDLDYTSKKEADWINSWKLRTSTSDEILARIIKKIQNATKGEKIGSLSLFEKGIYIGKYKIDDTEYPIAIYCNKSEISNLVKVQVSDEEELEKEENKKFIRCEETFFKYMIIAFYEEGTNEPAMVIQIEKFDISKRQNSLIEWLNLLKIIQNQKSTDLIAGNPLRVMEIVGTIESTKIGGTYGCVRYTDDPDAQNCVEWERNIPNFISFPGKNKVHDGIDLLAQIGTPVYAIFDGQAIVSTSTTLGNYILIKSNKEEHNLKNISEDIWVSYGHLSKTEDINETKIKQGQLIGYTGNTGTTAQGISAWRYHLHLTVYREGTNKYNRVNPINYIKTKFDNNGNKID
jgi:murein DD-endopeptidase MepM/ murein hydrolase activator NlpD